MTTADAAISAIPAGRLPAFADNQKLRLFLGTLLYLAQGFPQGVVFYAIPTWLAVNGQGAAVVGAAAAAASMPWMAKWAAGAVMDRYTYMPMGRRRPWLVGSQMCIALAFLALALLAPLPGETKLVIGFSFLISSLTAIQDVSLDALVIDLTPDSEMGRLNGFMFAGKLFGIAGGMAISGYFMQHYSLSAAMLAMLGLFSIPALSAILIRERLGERLLPWTQGQTSAAALAVKPTAWLPIITLAFKTLIRRDTLLVMGLLITYGTHQVLLEQGGNLFMAERLGWGEGDIGSLGAVSNIVFAVFSLTLGGWLIDRFGPRKIALLTGTAALAVVGGFALAAENLTSGWAYIAFNIGGGFPLTLFYLSFLVMAMRVSVAEVAATSFALIVATHALGVSMGAVLLGIISEAGGFTGTFGLAALLVFLSGLFTLGLSYKAAGPVAE